jgi:hypothetical protein
VTLVAAVEPPDAKNKVVTWSSNRASVATVSSAGEVTPVGEGTATITVATDDGGHTATCDVTVVTAVTGVSLSQRSLSLVVGGASATLEARDEPTGASNRNVTWSSTDEKVASVSPTGVVTALGSGIAAIRVTTEDGGVADTCDVAVAPDAVTDVVVETPLTGQAVISWTAPSDPNHNGVRVSVTSSNSSAVIPAEQTVAAGTNLIVLSGLAHPVDYIAALVVLGSGDMVAAPVGVSVSTVKVTHVVRSAYTEHGHRFILDETNGSGSQETHDVVILRANEEGIPTNYQWTFFPGLADPTDPALVSMMLESYDETSEEWELTDRFLRVNATYTHASYRLGQWYAWSDPDPDSHIAHCDLRDTTDAFSEEATFRMIPGPEADSVAFEWYAEPKRRLLHTWYHIMAQAKDTIDSDPEMSTWRFDRDSSWYLDAP